MPILPVESQVTFSTISSAAPHIPTANSVSEEMLSSPSFLNILLQFFLGMALHILKDFREREIYLTMLCLTWYKLTINALSKMKQPPQILMKDFLKWIYNPNTALSWSTTKAPRNYSTAELSRSGAKASEGLQA